MSRLNVRELENFLILEGLCLSCKQWLQITPKEPWLPEHNHQEKKCENSKYSPKEYRYRIRNAEDAKKLASHIMSDDDSCLEGMYHSLGCGDGQNCHQTRMRLAKALAHYVQTHD